jgi:rhodanese-related sulfurtransferase
MFGFFRPKGVSLSPAEARHLAESGAALLVDVREEGEWRAGHIAGAVHVPLSTFEKAVAGLPTEKRIILYCQSGMRSGRALDACRKLGLPIDTHMAGGIAAWRSAGFR